MWFVVSYKQTRLNCLMIYVPVWDECLQQRRWCHQLGAGMWRRWFLADDSERHSRQTSSLPRKLYKERMTPAERNLHTLEQQLGDDWKPFIYEMWSDKCAETHCKIWPLPCSWWIGTARWIRKLLADLPSYIVSCKVTSLSLIPMMRAEISDACRQTAKDCDELKSVKNFDKHPPVTCNASWSSDSVIVGLIWQTAWKRCCIQR